MEYVLIMEYQFLSLLYCIYLITRSHLYLHIHDFLLAKTDKNDKILNKKLSENFNTNANMNLCWPYWGEHFLKLVLNRRLTGPELLRAS